MTDGESQKASKRAITITFNQKIGVALIMSLEEYTPEECKLAWFQKDDYSQMEDECEFTSKFLENKKMLPPALCGRGLECWTSEGEKLKDKHVGMAVELVWQAQLAQWTNKGDEGGEEGNESDVCIAQEYVQITVPCHEAAHLIGLNDEKEVKRYLAPIKNMEKSRQKMQSRLAKSANASNTTDIPGLKPAIRKPTKTSSRSPKPPTRSKSPETHASSTGSPIPPKSKGPDLLEKIGRRIEENASVRSSRSLAKSITSLCSIDDDTPTSPGAGSIKSTKSYKKIDFRKPKRTNGIPLSPQGSVHSSGEFSSGSRRAFASHQSVCSEDGSVGSVRRRMLKAAAPLTL